MKRLLITIFIFSAIFGSAIYAASEIQSFTNCSAAFAVVRELDGDVWYLTGQVFEAWGTGARTALDYDIALTAESGGMFTGTFDTNISAGQYYVVTHDDADSTPADTDPAVWQCYGDWDGSTWTPGSFSEADIESEVNDALVALNLDHLMKTAVANNADMTTEVTDGTVLSNIMTSDSDTSGYVVADDSLEAHSAILALIKYKTDLITILDTTVATPNDTNAFTITAGIDVNDALNYHLIMVTDATDSHSEMRYIYRWLSDKELYVDSAFGFTPDTGDVVHIMGTGYGGFFDQLFAYLRRLRITTYYSDQSTDSGVTPGSGVTNYDQYGDDPP